LTTSNQDTLFQGKKQQQPMFGKLGKALNWFGCFTISHYTKIRP